MKRGLMVIDQLFPGVREDLLAAGSHLVDQGEDFRILYRSGWSPKNNIGLEILTFTRPLLESSIRRHLPGNPKIRFMEGSKSLGWSTRRRAHRRCRHPHGRAADRGESRSRSCSPIWWSTATAACRRLRTGCRSAATRRPRITVSMPSGATRPASTSRPRTARPTGRSSSVMNRPPYQPRAGIIQPVEGNRWLVTIAGVMHDYPPTDEEAFLQFANSLPSPELYKTIKHAKPASRIWGFRKT